MGDPVPQTSPFYLFHLGPGPHWYRGQWTSRWGGQSNLTSSCPWCAPSQIETFKCVRSAVQAVWQRREALLAMWGSTAMRQHWPILGRVIRISPMATSCPERLSLTLMTCLVFMTVRHLLVQRPSLGDLRKRYLTRCLSGRLNFTSLSLSDAWRYMPFLQTWGSKLYWGSWTFPPVA